MDFILSVRNISKTYPGVLALNDVSMDFRKGEVHAICGENGAGKSTLIKILSGSETYDKGEIYFEEKLCTNMSPKAAIDMGISVIYQEFSLVPQLSVAENIFLGNRRNNGIQIDKKLIEIETGRLMDELGINFSPKAKVMDLSPAYQQLVEIIRAISRNVRVLIMDEPSAPLTATEVQKMFGLINRLRERGISIIYISHRMEEIFQIADRVSVLRDGNYITTKEISDTDENELVNYMVGRELSNMYPVRGKTEFKDKAIEIKNLQRGNKLKNISLHAMKGEILGIAGLVGAGRTELVRCIFGADRFDKGEIIVKGKSVDIKCPSDAIKYGVALIPEDRKQQGLLLKISVGSNITLPVLKRISRFLSINKKKEKDIINTFVKELRIKTPDTSRKVKNLSGGNQQKVVLAKWLATKTDIIIFDEPTRGIDVGAKHEIYEVMNNLAIQGKTIIMISSDMPELLGMSDRILVIRDGGIRGELSREEATQEKILYAAAGIERNH